jgi:hypothetical protein
MFNECLAPGDEGSCQSNPILFFNPILAGRSLSAACWSAHQCPILRFAHFGSRINLLRRRQTLPDVNQSRKRQKWSIIVPAAKKLADILADISVG